MTNPYAAPSWYDPASLVRRLGGVYSVPINDGLGPLEGEVEIDGQPHFVREYPGRPEIQHRAAALITALEKGEMTDSHRVLDLIEELKKPADPLGVGKTCIVPIHCEAITRLKEFLPS